MPDESTKMPGTSLINVGELAKPATVLIEKISDAIGGLAKPWQTKRVAEADGQAAVIAAKARLEITALEERALQRMITEEAVKQDNIESITAKAIPHLSADSKAADVENDWISAFFDRCKLVSDRQMQDIWAAMLAGEANDPGSFSRRTIELVYTLDKTDAILFGKFGSLIWEIGAPTPLIHDLNQYESYGVSYVDFQHMESLGLVNIVEAGIQLPNVQGHLLFKYFDSSVVLQIPTARGFVLGKVLLTRPGMQLWKLCVSKRNDHYFERMLMQWTEMGFAPYQRIDGPKVEIAP